VIFGVAGASGSSVNGGRVVTVQEKFTRADRAIGHADSDGVVAGLAARR
jgi:hypothetical protein